jgi:cellulose synthase/poly-beta-1,6-N-acetylglucosamine synthase-like glycosyltransferase
VVADNCTDATATIAREAGVTVVERQDTQHRGKGYALDYGIGHLQNNPPDVVTIVDADCAVHPGSLATLAQAAHQHQRPVQSLYLMAKPPEPSLKDFVSAFAFKVKNLVRPAGLLRFNLPGPLAGTGMAFPWSILTTIDLAHGHIVEDMKLGLDLAIAGHPPLFCPQAQVTGALPSDDNASQSQRTRWEHGHLQLLFSYVPQLLYQGLVQRRFDLVAVALDLAIPPLSSLVLIWFVLTVVGGLFTTLTGFWFATLVLAIAGGLMVWAIAWAWYRYGRSDIPLGKLLGIPLYILWKIPLYFKFLFKPQTEWVRTKRDHSNDN